MADDYGNSIAVQIVAAPILLDETVNKGARFVLGYLKAVYETDEDITVTIYVRRNSSMEYELVDTHTLSKDNKRYKRKIKLVGSVIDYYPQLDITGKDFVITSLTINRKIFTTGKY